MINILFLFFNLDILRLIPKYSGTTYISANASNHYPIAVLLFTKHLKWQDITIVIYTILTPLSYILVHILYKQNKMGEER